MPDQEQGLLLLGSCGSRSRSKSRLAGTNRVSSQVRPSSPARSALCLHSVLRRPHRTDFPFLGVSGAQCLDIYPSQSLK